MADPSSAPTGAGDDADTDGSDVTDADAESPAASSNPAADADVDSASSDDGDDIDGDDADLEALRREVEEKYDFENFGPADMAEMTLDEWEAAFDPDSWIVGEELLDRVEKDLLNRIARREVFAVVERVPASVELAGDDVDDADTERLIAYSDEGYAVIYPDGSVEGRGTVLRDVKPTVALCSMESYEVREPPADVSLPDPDDVAEGTGEFGNFMLQIVAGGQILAGFTLFGAWALTWLDVSWYPYEVTSIVAPIMAGVFVLIGLFLFATVANARLSDRFRAEEYRNRLRAISLESEERPEFLPRPEETDSVRRDDREPQGERS